MNCYKNSVVAGRSILSSAAKILNNNITQCTFLEYKTFSDFLESVILHDYLYIYGNFTSFEEDAKELYDKLNSYDNRFIYIIDDKTDILTINNVNIDEKIKDLISRIFSNKISLPSFVSGFGTVFTLTRTDKNFNKLCNKQH